MEEHGYIIPANSKRSALLFGLFRGIDLIILICGGVFTMFLFFLIPNDSFKAVVIKLMPLLIGVFLVAPIANYHNVLVLIREITSFFLNRRRYLWKGWCASNVTKEK